MTDEEIMQFVFDYADGKASAEEVAKELNGDDFHNFLLKLNEVMTRCERMYVPQ